MVSERFTRESFWAELDGLEDEEIRGRINAGNYTSKNSKRELAQQFLDYRERLRNDASQSEQINIARSAKDAAWEAAEQAREANRRASIANRIATAALVIAAIAAICAVISLFLR